MILNIFCKPRNVVKPNDLEQLLQTEKRRILVVEVGHWPLWACKNCEIFYGMTLQTPRYVIFYFKCHVYTQKKA
jgi:hypothetical protein